MKVFEKCTEGVVGVFEKCSEKMSCNRGIKLTALSIQQKLDIAQKLDNGESVSALAMAYCVHPTTVRRIRRNKLALHQLDSKSVHIRRIKKVRKPKYDELENRLRTWFLERRVLGDTISDLRLQKKAMEMATQFAGTTGFKASRGWVAKFKNRQDIRLVNIYGEKGSADVAAAEEFTASFIRKIQEEDIQLENIYNMDETGLAWKAVPTKTLAHGKEAKISGKKVKKDRVSVGLCANATGTHKLTPLFVYKFENPRALKHVKNKLPVIFKSQKSAWVDQKVFADWYENHFKPAVRKQQLESGGSGKIFLLLDNFGRHQVEPSKCKTDKFEIMFLPPNTTSILQPMDQGIIAKMKRSFRHKLLRRILDYPGGIQEFHRKYDLKDCINFVHEAWGDVEPINIANAWKKIMRNIPLGTPVTEEEPTDPLEAELGAMIGAIIEEEPTEQRLIEYLKTCEETETLSVQEINDKENETQQEEPLEEEEEEEEEGKEEEGGEEEEEEKVEKLIVEEEEEPVGETEQEKEPVAETEQEEDIKQENLHEELSSEDWRIRHLQELFADFQMHTQDEPEFVKDTIVNLRNHFLRSKKK